MLKRFNNLLALLLLTACLCVAPARAQTTPTGLSATPNAYGQEVLTWSGTADHYIVRRAGGSFLAYGGTTFTDTGLAQGTTYFYTVFGVTSAGNVSAPSSPLSVTAPAQTGAAPFPTNTIGVTPPAVAVGAGSSTAPPVLSGSWQPAALWSQVWNAKTGAVIAGSGSALPVTLAGDGATNDLPNLQTEENYVTMHGGGVLYLPAGTYLLNNSSGGLQFGSSIALVGDGPGLTVLSYPSGLYQMALFVGSQMAGISNLSLVCTAGLEAAPYNGSTVRASLSNSGTPSNVYLKNVTVTEGPQEGAGFSSSSHVDIEDSIFDGSVSNYSPVSVSNSADVLFTRNTLRGHNGRFNFLGDPYLIWTANNITRDGGVHVPVIETGGLQCGYSDHCYVADNNFSTVGLPNLVNNDGEEILTQDDSAASTPRFRDTGTWTTTAATTLTDSTKNWSLVAWPAGTMVFLTNNSGLGEYQLVTSHTASSVTPAGSWLIPPAPGDTYSIYTPSSWAQTFARNTFHTNAQGIQVYGGAVGDAIINNSLTSSGSVRIYAQDRGSGVHYVAWNNVISGNKVSNPWGLRYSTLGIIGVQSTPTFGGNLAFGNTITGNTIYPHAPGQTVAADGTGITADGTYEFVTTNSGLPGLISDNVAGLSNGSAIQGSTQ